MPREIPGVTALAAAFPSNWLLYVSLTCYPKHQAPMEIDAFVVMEDRVLILEIKDWNGKLTNRGDQWLINGGSRGRSAVSAVTEKARKLKSLIRSEIPGLRSIWVDSRVVLTGTATKQLLPAAEQALIWTLREACSIADPAERSRRLDPVRLGLLRAFQFEKDFDRFTGNPKLFQPMEADWGGFRVVTPDLFVHPTNIWREHGAERKSESRLKALVRIWSFDRLPAGLNSADRRQFIAQRELRAVAELTSQGSELLTRDRILRPIGDGGDEILTQHYEIRSLTQGWTTLDRFLERESTELRWEDRILLAATLLSIVAGLHAHGIAHRDLGPRALWVGDPTRMAVSGLMSSSIPGEETVADWMPVLRGYAPKTPDEAPHAPKATGMQRDVYLAGRLVEEILTGCSGSASALTELAEEPWAPFWNWLKSATHSDPGCRFRDGRVMADQFGEVVDRLSSAKIDQQLIDHFETSNIPYVQWPPLRQLSMTGRRAVYVSAGADRGPLTVKIWNGVQRGASTETDLALIRLFEGVTRVIATPIEGLPQFIQAGLSPVGAFVVYQHVTGVSLDTVTIGSTEVRARIADQLLNTIAGLHGMGASHGDVAPKNIIFDAATERQCLLDAFDLPPIGAGRLRTPAYCPANWEVLGEQPLDRFASITVVRDLLLAADDTRCAEALQGLDMELQRPSIESLDPARAHIRRLLERLREPPVPTFKLSDPHGERAFRSDGTYFLTSERVGVAARRLRLSSLDSQLCLDIDKGVLVGWHFVSLPFHALASVSASGIPVRAEILVEQGTVQGFRELLDFLLPHLPPVDDATEIPSIASPSVLNVPLLWSRLTELEQEARPSVEITAELGVRQGVILYEYQPQGPAFDFDPDSIVDFHLLNGKRAGQIDLSRTDAATLAVRLGGARLSTGDVVTLHDRRERVSFDRRNKAITRILGEMSAIPKLIEYFSGGKGGASIDYGIEIPDTHVEPYELNDGQLRAFRDLLRFGPLGLLQGPPGTGKTHFIASIVHWLVTHGGARRVLIASQSHEAVNNAIEALVSLFRKLDGRPSLLRIGSKGITAKIRPFHTQALRERYLQRFDGAMKSRVTQLAAAMGVKRTLAAEALNIDRTLGRAARRLDQWAQMLESAEDPEDRVKYAQHYKRVANSFRESGREFGPRALDPARATEEVESLYEELSGKTPGSSPADVRAARRVVDLARDWRESLASPQRNFEEFLAKTRTIITATCVGVGQTKIRIDASDFDWVIVDEAARCTPGELAVPIQMGRRVLLVGDHLQLKPMIDQELIEKVRREVRGIEPAELSRSDFERAFASNYGLQHGRALTQQYRMHPAICELVSQVFYEPHRVRLTTALRRSHTSVFDSSVSPVLRLPITWLDTSEAPDSHDKKREPDTTYFNFAEVDAVMRILEGIAAQPELVNSLESLDEESPIGVITMYLGQKDRLQNAFSKRAWEARFKRLVRIDTVDAYQGKENTLVIVSLVRANSEGNPGHVSTPNRCNVAISRAKDRLVIVGALRMWGSQHRERPMRRVVEFIRANQSSAQILASGDLP